MEKGEGEEKEMKKIMKKAIEKDEKGKGKRKVMGKGRERE